MGWREYNLNCRLLPKLNAMRYPLPLLLSALLLSACAHSPKPEVSVATPPPAAPPERIVQEDPPPVLPEQELSDEWLYEFMLSEFAAQRGHNDLAAVTAGDLARKTRDPRVAKRAAQLAFGSGQMERTLEAFRYWLELEPGSSLARRMYITLLLGGGRLDEAKPVLAELLAANKFETGRVLMQTYPMLAPYPDKAKVLLLLTELTQPYPEVPESHWVLAQAAQANNDRERALTEVRRARSLRAEWDAPAMFEAQLLLPQEQGLTVLKSYLEAHSDAREVRLFYARTLLGQKKLAQSREQFQKVLAADPENSDIAFAIALISMQMGELDVAEDQLKQALRQGNKDEDTMRYYLGQLNEARQHEGEAMDDYRAVKAGEHHFTAQLRLAFLLNKAGKLEEAREVLHQTSPINNVQRVAAVSMEAQFLREAEQFEAAYQVLLKALEKLPNHADLLYEAAMMADRAGRYGEMEKLLRKLIEIKPDNAHAYNALGYSLLERNERLSEAALLVEKALQLEPNDPAIQDSAGWAAYRQGDYDKSVGLLRRAYAVNPDPEIAAHLVEVLWQKGERAEAERLLRDNLKTHPDDKLLLGVKQRLKP